ncbi:MAG: hypothetical protein MUF72_13910 [Elainella sp. Prado103]|nr:hypothetical protein [Elainella sp. Prado103]
MKRLLKPLLRSPIAPLPKPKIGSIAKIVITPPIRKHPLQNILIPIPTRYLSQPHPKK